MKRMKRFALVIVLATVTMFAIGQTNEEVTKMLSNTEARMLIMDQISGDVTMSQEMMSKIMDACKADTTIRNCMMSGMMHACKSDSAMMKSMHRHMMENPPMKDAMDQRMKESQKSKAVEGLDKTTLTVIKKNY
ncbi:MAG: hypothetical protein IH592_07125 [Bacteroidales bacterium]|nr:hypothetical protein [Bacteroidales bacterium]